MKKIVFFAVLIFLVNITIAQAGLVNNGDGTVTDTATGFMWQQNTAEIVVDGNVDASDYMNWEDAITYCENLSLAGHDDWRLPNINELISLNNSSFNPNINTSFFSAVSHDYWSSTTYIGLAGFAKLVHLEEGIDTQAVKLTSGHYVRAVRGGL